MVEIISVLIETSQAVSPFGSISKMPALSKSYPICSIDHFQSQKFKHLSQFIALHRYTKPERVLGESGKRRLHDYSKRHDATDEMEDKILSTAIFCV